MITLLAHGSPDPRHSRGVRALAARVGPDAVACYLETDEPDPAGCARALGPTGTTESVVVALLIGPAYHARVDVPRAVEQMRAQAPGIRFLEAGAVGLHPLLLSAAAELAVRHAEGGGSHPGPAGAAVLAGLPPTSADEDPTRIQAADLPFDNRTGLVLGASGSRDPGAVAATAQLVRDGAADLCARLGVGAVAPAFLDGGPDVASAREELARQGCDRFLMVALFIAEGVLRDRLVDRCRALSIPVAAGGLCDTQSLADLVRIRAREAQDS